MSVQIYATFGPSCGQENVLKEMILAGMSGMRLNLSHATLPASKSYIEAYQKAARECGVNPQILIDMQGPELRIGKLEEISLKENDVICLHTVGENDLFSFEEECIKKRVPVPQAVLDAAQVGDRILLDDGKIQMEVECHHTKAIAAKILRGGILRSHKSIKIQNRNVKMPVLTEHDMENLRLAKSYGVTALMQPFVLSGEDLRYVRDVLKENQAEDIQIFAKIENRMGVENQESILPEADVIIIARGDLGNDMPLWELPAVQKQIEKKCKEYHKPYIVVTQMLASMEEYPVPTRAEVSDIFHAVYHGAWGVMITGESAIGKYPVEAVRYLTNTSRTAEKRL